MKICAQEFKVMFCPDLTDPDAESKLVATVQVVGMENKGILINIDKTEWDWFDDVFTEDRLDDFLEYLEIFLRREYHITFERAIEYLREGYIHTNVWIKDVTSPIRLMSI